jgi:hypothetical protein
VRIIEAVVLAVMLTCPTPSAKPGIGSVCVAPIPVKPSPYSAPPGFLCDSAKLSLKIDGLKPIPWPVRGSVNIDALDATAAHFVVIYCNGKPQQSFKFRFSDFKTRALCLFINDFYKTAQLWESEGTPWCKCKQS